MKLDLSNLDRIHPVVLKEIGGALTRIAAALDTNGVADAEGPRDEPEGLLENFFNNKTVEIDIPRGDVVAPLLETPEQVDELLGVASPIGAIAKDVLAAEAGPAVQVAIPSQQAEPLPPVEYVKPPGTFEEFQAEAVAPTPYEQSAEAMAAQDGFETGQAHSERTTAMAPELAAPYGQEPIELDAAGLPWDARIHAGTKTHTKDKCWKFKPRTAQETKDEVTAELRLTYPPITAPTVQTDPTTGHVLPSAEEVFGENQQTAAAPLEYTFVSLLEEICLCVTNEQVTQGACDIVVADRCKEFGITGLPDLQARPDLVMPFRDRLNDILGARF